MNLRESVLTVAALAAAAPALGPHTLSRTQSIHRDRKVQEAPGWSGLGTARARG